MRSSALNGFTRHPSARSGIGKLGALPVVNRQGTPSSCSLTAITYLRRQRGWLKRVILGDEAIAEIPDQSINEADLETCIRQLPERARVVFVLHAIEGFRHEDIARICGIAVGSSKAHLHRARQLLQEWMTHEH